jgi:plastocyanin
MKSAIGATLAIAFAASLHAATLELTVTDARGAPLEDAVAYATPRERSPAAPKPAAVAQKDKQFVPFVSVVQAGAPVSFPNRDPFRHHVYSFSPAKNFEIKLYAGTPADPIVFDKPGEVVLGCNIHDSMLGYIYVVDTPYFAKTDRNGRARIELPPGDYELMSWHPAQAALAQPRAVSLRRADESLAIPIAILLKPLPPRPVSN